MGANAWEHNLFISLYFLSCYVIQTLNPVTSTETIKVTNSPSKMPTNKHIIPADSICVNKQLGVGEFGIVQQGVWTNGSERVSIFCKFAIIATNFPTFYSSFLRADPSGNKMFVPRTHAVQSHGISERGRYYALD